MEELILYNEYKGRGYILIFERKSDFNYSYKAELKFPKGYIVKSGRLSKDGLEYFISLERQGQKPRIYTLKRNSIEESFGSFDLFDSDLVNGETHRNHQCFFSADKQFAVFTRSLQNEWDSNAIYIACTNATDKDTEEIYETEVETETGQHFIDDLDVFPNPAIDNIYFRGIGSNQLTVLIYDSNGRLVRKIDEIKDNQAIDITNFFPGSYYLKLIDVSTGDYKIVKQIKL